MKDGSKWGVNNRMAERGRGGEERKGRRRGEGEERGSNKELTDVGLLLSLKKTI